MNTATKKKPVEKKLPPHVEARLKKEREINIAWEQHNKWRAEQPE